jgi:hypothetical protein
MGFVIIGGIVGVLVALTVRAKSRERARVEAIMRAGAAGELHGVHGVQAEGHGSIGVALGGVHASLHDGPMSQH